MASLIGDNKVDQGVLDRMRRSGYEHWAAYQNHDMGHSELGHTVYLAYGEGRVFKAPPKTYPDTANIIGWRYQLVGTVDLETGTIKEV